jgi:hypothetical protein
MPLLDHFRPPEICLPVELEATYERTCLEQRVQPAA